MKIFNNIYKYITIAATLLATTACSDDLPMPSVDEGEGQPVTVKVNVELPKMSVKSRADMYPGLDEQVHSLWVGVYNVNSKKRTGNQFFTEDKSPSHGIPEEITLNTFTGNSYIVAVANYDGRTAHNGSNIVNFKEALEQAETWEQFLEISAMFDEEGSISIQTPVRELLMSGHYMDKEPSHTTGDYTEIKQVYISKNGNLDGAIHLRRLISHIKFDVKYNTANISDFEITGWTVHNVPNQSWLYESNTRETINVGDTRKIGSSSSYAISNPDNFVSVSDNTYTFDWWQLENKRTGRENVTEYNHRELEYKDNLQNTGKYSSLVAEDDKDNPNNNATFVELRVRMTMKVDENGVAFADGTSRVAEGVYTIHLGYCEEGNATSDDEKESAKAKDFNCRRNTKYIYNVTIENVNKILVEAKRESDDPMPGAEGVISDVDEEYIILDAHYGQYNITLTEQDLKDFNYRIICTDGNDSPVEINSFKPQTIPNEENKNYKYLSWVELRKIGGNEKCAPYKPRSATSNIDNRPTYNIEEFRKLTTTLADLTELEGTYTVFFNEYVYEEATNGNENGSKAWVDYVNKPDRQVWFCVQLSESNDTESAYYKSKYAFSQKSIQTYYDIPDVTGNDNTTALGIEHINESYGLNLRRTFDYGRSADNGRFNTAAYIANAPNNNWQPTSWRDDNYEWADFVDLYSMQTINEINTQQVSQAEYTEAHPRPLPSLSEITPTASTYETTIHKYDPDQTTRAKYIEAINACMNRNRDLDGDGYIDRSELRWYVPTVNKYVRMILGRRSLATPIMDYDRFNQLKYPLNADGTPLVEKVGGSGYNRDNAQENGLITSLLLFGSNTGDNVLWAMEGTSTSEWLQYHAGAWNVRCVRSLGIDMSTLTDTEKATPAYQLDGTNKVVLKYYEAKSIRSEQLSEMMPHHIADQRYNRCYKAFQVSNTELTVANLSSDYSGDWSEWLENDNPCKGLNTEQNGSGWRVPNQKEITIMNTLRDKLSPQISGTYISATFSFYNSSGYAYGKNPNQTDDMTFANRKIMSIRDNGALTQMSFVDLKYYGAKIRCVRDVEP